jgi:2-polyprenyl-3-methyl-5-hydroxy-6-metoxy-1,4-benzoquinol methylase
MSSSWFATLSNTIEIMDDLDCSGEVVHQTLRELEFINRTLGGNSFTVSGVNQILKTKKIRNPEILDLGCGGGDMLLLLKKKFNHSYPDIKLHGVDANLNIIQYAVEHCADNSIRFSTLNIFSEEFRKLNCDIGIATLFFHHFTADQLVDVLGRLKSQCRVGIVINDLHRHPLAYYSIKLLTQFFSKSSMVKFDAPLSVMRGFTRLEWEEILRQAGITDYTLKWKWAFRWEILIRS